MGPFPGLRCPIGGQCHVYGAAFPPGLGLALGSLLVAFTSSVAMLHDLPRQVRSHLGSFYICVCTVHFYTHCAPFIHKYVLKSGERYNGAEQVKWFGTCCITTSYRP